MKDPLIVDVYAGDLNGRPDWGKLAKAGWPWCGAIIKATEGLDYHPPWFGINWSVIHAAGGERYGRDWFRGCYHYARVDQDPVKQAHLYLSQVDHAGGWDVGDLWPMLDVEGANNPEKPGKAKLEDWISTYAREIEMITGRKPMLYGNIYLYENEVFGPCGCGTLIVARYTPTLPMTTYTRIGWSWSDKPDVQMPTLWGWQYAGDGTAFVDGYPSQSPIGDIDITAVVVAGGGTQALEWTRRHLFAEKPDAA